LSEKPNEAEGAEESGIAGYLSRGHQSQDQRDEEDHEENKEQDFRNFSRISGYPAETEGRRDEGDNEKYKRPFQHSVSSDRDVCPRSLAANGQKERIKDVRSFATQPHIVPAELIATAGKRRRLPPLP